MTEETFTVKLGPHERKIPRESFRQMFPECIWNSALEMSTDTVIEVTHPSVTRKIVTQIQVMCYQKTYDADDPEITQEEYRAAHRYLNIPIFACMLCPEYNRYWFPDQAAKIRQVTLADYPGYMTFTVNAQTLAVMEYVWAKIPASETVNIDQHALIMAAKKGDVALIEGLLRRGLTPLTEHKCSDCKVNALLTASRAGMVPIVKMMVPRLCPVTVIGYLPLIHIESARIILQHPGIETQHLFQAVKLLTHGQLLDLTEDLIGHPKMSRAVLEQFDFLRGIPTHYFSTFLSSELSRAEDLPILLIRCLQDLYAEEAEIILRDSRMTRAIVLAFQPLSAILRRQNPYDQITIEHQFDQWLRTHPA
jgi:hypothetical protein